MAFIPPVNVHEASIRELDFSPNGLGEPTDAIPGSDEKIEVMRRRAEQGVELYHPDDLASFETPMAALALVRLFKEKSNAVN